MEAKEKAEKMYNDMYYWLPEDLDHDFKRAISLRATITQVEEIIRQILDMKPLIKMRKHSHVNSHIMYWQSVKTILNTL